MIVWQELLETTTGSQGLFDITAQLAEKVRKSGIRTGLCHVFILHTSASLVIQENADGKVQTDLEAWLMDLAPESRAWTHDDEGPDDMPAHARAAVTKTSELIPVHDGELALGTWQALYIWEHRRRPTARKLWITITGTTQAQP